MTITNVAQLTGWREWDFFFFGESIGKILVTIAGGMGCPAFFICMCDIIDIIMEITSISYN